MSLNDVVLCAPMRTPIGMTGAVVTSRLRDLMRCNHLTRSTARMWERIG
jgi:hypothetical protein